MTASYEVGELVAGRYRVERELGRGAMGAVYRVRDEHGGRVLALKHLQVADEGQRAMLLALFEREFHTLAELAHPLIIEVFDYGQSERGAYYTMELLDGEDLDARAPLDFRTACALLRDVASSLAIVHSRRLVHRDVAPRNVRCTASGRAKLIDFGAMAPAGVARHLVGTPPFVAPEALQQQPLDGRSDLFALGALGYFMLSGAHAYPARTMSGLRDAWLRPPVPLERRQPELRATGAAALCELIAELLQLDPNARPASAAVVIERLCAIAGLPTEEHLEVSRAYLVTPRLVGRDGALARVRAQLARLADQRGGSVLIEGRGGSGRSRLLDACVLEAKLAGCSVLRADAGDAGHELGVARALLQQLNHEGAPGAPVAAGGAAALPANGAGAVPATRTLVERLLRAAGTRPLAIAVDDLERVDAASLRVLASLAHRAARRRVLLFATAERGAGSAGRDGDELVGLLRARSLCIELAPLSGLESEALVRSLFGDTAHVVTTAGRIHQLSQGYPRDALKLAEHLVERGIARHEAGGWLLPSELKPGDLPESLNDAMRARLAALGPDARELAQMFALSDPALFSLERYAALLGGPARDRAPDHARAFRASDHARAFRASDHARAFRALDELVAAAVLVPLGNRHRFSQSGWAPLIAGELGAERRQQLHARHAQLLAREGHDNPRLAAHHLLESGQAERAIALLLERRNDQRFELSRATLDLVTRALARADALGLPPRVRVELQAWLVSIASVIGERATFERYAPSLLARLSRDGGLEDHARTDPALSAPERLHHALVALQARHDRTPEGERGLPPIESIQRLGRVCVDHVALAGVVCDLALVERVPRLDALLPLSPALWTVQQMADGMRCFQQARYGRARELFLAALARIEQPDRLGGIPASYHQSVRLGVLYLIGLIEAGFGIPSAPERLAALELEPGYRVNGLRTHMAFALNQGDIVQAREHERRAELAQLEDGPEQCFPLTSARLELSAYIASDDLLGVKRCVERLHAAAERYGSGSEFTQLARAQYRRLQGDHTGALHELQPLLAVAPLSQQTWPWVARTHVQVLIGLERVAEAAELGRRQLAIAVREDITPSHRLIAAPTVQALALAGRVDEAVAIADRGIAEVEAEGMRGLHRGEMYEARARAAAAQGDDAGFRHFAERCSIEYRVGRNPALVAKYERLMQLGRHEGLCASAIGTGAEPASATASAASSTLRSLITSEYGDPRAAQ